MYYNCDHWVEISVSGGGESARVELVALDSRIDYASGESSLSSMTDRIIEFFGTEEVPTGEVRRSPDLNSGPDWHPWTMTKIVTWKQVGTAVTMRDSASTRCE